MKLSEALREVARRWFEYGHAYSIFDRSRVDAFFGICKATKDVKECKSSGVRVYQTLMRLFKELGYEDPNNPFQCKPNPENWEQRAYMCLFLAEYLEETGR